MAKTKSARNGQQTRRGATASTARATTTAGKKGAAAKQAPAAKKATSTAVASFAGFPADAFQFLAELALHNEREWFEPRKDRYEASVREPALAFIRAVGTRLAEVSPHFVAIDKKAGGSLMRVNRDVRFSSDKSPYKTNVGIQFRHATGKDVHAPGLYVHIEPGECFVGVGLWHPEPEPLARIRERLVDAPRKWLAIRDEPTFASTFTLQGESLKRPPRGFEADHPLADDLRRKDHIAVAPLSVATLRSPRAVDEVMRTFLAARSYLRFLCEAVDVAF